VGKEPGSSTPESPDAESVTSTSGETAAGEPSRGASMGHIEEKLAERAMTAPRAGAGQVGLTAKQITGPKGKGDEISSRPAYISCPVCHAAYKCHFSTSVIEKVTDGMARILVKGPCEHKFLVFVDSNLRVRSIERIDHEGVVCEHADTEFLERHIKQLEERHAQMAKDKEYNEAFELMQQIKSAKKELEALKNKIVVK